MRVLLVYPDLDIYVNFPVGLGIISSCLKAGGHDTRIIHLNQEKGFPLDFDRIREVVDEFKPELIGFSTTTAQFKYVLKLADFFKGMADTPIVCGGNHPTIAVEAVLSSPSIDFVIRGEGERAVLSLADCLEKGTDWSGIENLAYKSEGRVVVNPMGSLIDDLDSIPFPDREGFDFGKIVSLKSGWANIMAGRGCPYHCTYCVNNYYHAIYAERHKVKSHLRVRSVPTVLREIEEMVAKYPDIRLINFDDDLFTQDEQWLEEFCEGYKAKFKLSLACNIRVNFFNERIAKMLYDAGCREVKIGLESGNERIRGEVLKRKMSDDTIIKAFKTAEDAGLRAWTFNMIGIPTETKSEIMDTVRLNAKIRPYILRCSVFYPYEGTDLYNYCRENDMLNEDKKFAYASYFEGSVLKLEGLSEIEILKAKKMFKWLVDSESDIETAQFYSMLVKYFDQIPDDKWESGEAQEMIAQTDKVVDSLFKILKKEHYSSRKQLDLNFTERLGFELPDA